MLLDYNGELPKEFFNKGFLHATIGTISEAQQVFESLINDCDVKNLWFEKYSGIKNSSVPPFSVNNSLDEFFRKNEILEKIRFASGRNLVLAHAQLRKTSNLSGYATWHLDTFINKEKRNTAYFLPR